MTEPSSARPVPGPPRPGPASADGRPSNAPAGAPAGSDPAGAASPAEEAPRSEATSFEDLGERPVAEHVGVYEAEHARLQRELGTIDQL